MLSYVLRKILYFIPVVWGVVTVVFILVTIVPGDPARLLMGQRGDPETLAGYGATWASTFQFPGSTSVFWETFCGATWERHTGTTKRSRRPLWSTSEPRSAWPSGR
jgi:ABC-type dipeptide/oligopeptide/nickel transport system permease component